MNSQPTTQTLIVGAGLAGCVLARRLEQQGHEFKMIGSTALPAAFKVAAGVINPVTGRWMTKSWRFDDFAPEAEQFYREIENEFSVSIYQHIPEVRYCLNADDARRAQRRSRNPRYANVLGGYAPAGQSHPAIYDPHGSFPIHGAAYVDLPLLVDTLRQHYNSRGRLVDETFNHAGLTTAESGWSYLGESYTRVIFCEGTALQQNPWFAQLPLTPAKGETLLCTCHTLQLSGELLHHQKWLLPYPDGSFRIGATYDESDLSEAPTNAGTQQLLDGFHTMTAESHEPTLQKHLAGIRPSTQDARPFLGQHPEHPGLFIFNGLGSKGASLAPTLSRELTEHIFERRPLDPETSIARFTCA